MNNSKKGMTAGFRPLRDCTKIVNAIEKAMTLSPPYGDCTAY